MTINKTTTDFRRDLYLLAQAQKILFTINKDWVEPLPPAIWGNELYQLACRVCGADTLPDEAILPSLFEEGAVKILSTLPNRFWFWRIVEAAVTAAGNGRGKIAAEAIHQAMAAERNQVAIAHDLSLKIADLDHYQVAERVALGICVVRSRLLPDPGLVLNPVYVYREA